MNSHVELKTMYTKKRYFLQEMRWVLWCKVRLKICFNKETLRHKEMLNGLNQVNGFEQSLNGANDVHDFLTCTSKRNKWLGKQLKWWSLNTFEIKYRWWASTEDQLKIYEADMKLNCSFWKKHKLYLKSV